MKLINFEPMIKSYGNGFQITFPNKYTVIVKNGPGAQCTQLKKSDDPADMMLTARFGGNSGPDVEVEVYSPDKLNISSKFGDANSLGFISTLELVNILYIVSSLR